MKKSTIIRKTFVFLIIIFFLNGCDDNPFLNYDNPLDPGSDNFGGEIIVSEPDFITIVSLKAGEEIAFPQLTLSECHDASAYRFQISSSETSFEENILWENDETVVFSIFPDFDWEEGITYYWRGAAADTEGLWGAFSEIGSFSVTSVISSISPTDNGTTMDTTPLLDWADVTGASGYNVRYAATEAGLTSAVEHSVTASEYQMGIENIFAYGDTVYWQIKAVNEDGAEGAWSAVSSFSVSWDVVWSGLSLADSGTTMDTTPLLDWGDVTGADGYKVRYSTIEGDLSGLTGEAVTTSQYQLESSEVLSYGATVYWQIKAVNEDGAEGAWSAVSSFSVSWDVVWSGLSLADSGTTMDTTPLLDWGDVTGADGYKVRYSTIEGDLSGLTGEAVTTSQYQLESSEVLSYGATVYWQIKAVNEDGAEGAWSAVSSFSVSWDVVWSGLSPADSGTTIDTTPLLDWADVIGADGYKVRYSTIEGDLSGLTGEAVTTSQYQLESSEVLAYGDTVYWQIKAVNEDGAEGAWSAVSSFSVSWDVVWSGLSPADSGTTMDTTPLLNWGDVTGATGYKVRFSTIDTELSGLIGIVVTNSDYQIELSDVLAYGDTVYWQVKAVNGDGAEGAWSSVYSFTVSWEIEWSGISPTDNGTTVDTTPLLDWADATGAAGYQVKYALSTEGLDTATIQNVIASNLQVEDTFSNSEEVFWQLCGVNGDSVSGDWSEVFSFTIEINCGIVIVPDINDEIEITFSGQGSLLEIGNYMTIAAEVDATVTEWQWYLDGEAIFGASSDTLTFGSELPLGTYTVTSMVMVDGKPYTRSHNLRVVKVSTFIVHIVDDAFEHAHSVYAADMDNDGDMDILGGGSDVEGISWWENDGNESFTKHVVGGTASGVASIYAADVDSDGDMDILGVEIDSDDINWWENNGSESFTKHTINGVFDGLFPSAHSVYTVDVDSDGDIDILGAGHANEGCISWLENDGAESFTKHVVSSVDSAIQSAYSVHAADMDGDGDIDILGAGYPENPCTAVWFENDGDENFVEHIVGSDYSTTESVSAVDVDNDGDMDIIVAADQSRIEWWENDGNESFSVHILDTYFAYAYSVSAVDLDSDGDIDILGVALNEDYIAVWKNDGNENFVEYKVEGGFYIPRSVCASDIDSDGDVDILVTDSYVDEIMWWENSQVP